MKKEDRHTDEPGTVSDNDQRIQELGYTPVLRRKLSLTHLLGLTMANVSPSVGLTLVSTAVFSIGGTFLVASNLIVGFVVILIMLCLAELGAAYPLTGGVYSLAYKVLPRPMMWICLFGMLLSGCVGMASISLGLGAFLKTLIPAIQLPDNLIAIVALCIASYVASVKVEIGALTTAGMVIIESLVLGVIITAGLLYPHQQLADILFHPVVLKDAGLSPVTFSMAVPTLAATFNLIVGYESVLGFSEELKGDHKTLIKATVTSALLAILLIAVPTTAAIVAAPDLVSFFRSSTPVMEVIQQLFGSSVAKGVNFCILIALFTLLLSVMMYMGRILYATGRDNIWWKAANRKLTGLNKQQVPGFAVFVSLVGTVLFAFVGALNWLIIFTASCLIIMYFMIGFAGFWSRYKFPLERRPYRMPLWPFIPLFVMLFTMFAFFTQEVQYQVGGIILIALAFVCWGIKKAFSEGVT